jgi:hypothetical protein
VTEVDARVRTDWSQARQRFGPALPVGDLDQYDELVLDLIRHSDQMPRPADEWNLERYAERLWIGARTGSVLAEHLGHDTETLAAVSALPWFDRTLTASHLPLMSELGPLTWPRALVLAMVPSGERYTGQDEPGERARLLRALAALPPLLRAATMQERHLASQTRHLSRRAAASHSARPLDAAELRSLSDGIPPELLPPPGSPPSRPPEPDIAPVGSPDEAVSLVRRHEGDRINGFHMTVRGGVPGYLVDSHELFYAVRWDVPSEAIQPAGPGVGSPGDTADRLPFTHPVWIIDRTTGHLDVRDLSARLDRHVADARNLPLPPGWRPARRGLPGSLEHHLTALLPAPRPDLVTAVVEHYTATLATDDWPDVVHAYAVATDTVTQLRDTGFHHPDIVTAALLVARATTPDHHLVAPTASLWHTPAGQLARHLTATLDDAYPSTDPTTALALAPPHVRALALAHTYARARLEKHLLGVIPTARDNQLRQLTTINRDLPEPLWYPYPPVG